VPQGSLRDTLTGRVTSLAFSNNPVPATGSRAFAGGTPISSAGTTGLGSPGTTGAVCATGPVASAREGMGREDNEEVVPTVGAEESIGGGMNGAVIFDKWMID